MSQPLAFGRKLPLNDWEGDDGHVSWVTCTATSAGRAVAWATNGRIDKDGTVYRAASPGIAPGGGQTLQQVATGVASRRPSAARHPGGLAVGRRAGAAQGRQGRDPRRRLLGDPAGLPLPGGRRLRSPDLVQPLERDQRHPHVGSTEPRHPRLGPLAPARRRQGVRASRSVTSTRATSRSRSSRRASHGNRRSGIRDALRLQRAGVRHTGARRAAPRLWPPAQASASSTRPRPTPCARRLAPSARIRAPRCAPARMPRA